MLAILKQKIHQLASVNFVGPLTNAFEVKKFLQKNPYSTLFIDRGADYRPSENSNQYWNIGDGDSSGKKMDVLLPKNKDVTDFSYALNLIGPNTLNIHLIGFIGERLDHQLAIFGDCYQFLKNQLRAKINFQDQLFFFPAGENQIEIQGTFSLFSLESAQLKLTGDCKYPISNSKTILPLGGFTVSNIGHGQIMIECDRPILLILPSL